MTQRLPYEDLDFIVRRTLDLWEEMRGQSVFLTGGTGFFGVWLLESLQAANRASGLGVQATILTRNPEAFRLVRPHLAMDPAITLLRGDVRHFSFPEGRFKYVIHAATDTWAREGSGGAVGLLGTILGGTERVLQFAAAHGTEKLLFTSSGAVYGQQPAQMTHIDAVRGLWRKIRLCLQDRALLCVCGAAAAAESALRHWKFHPGCAAGRGHLHSGRRHGAAFLHVRCGLGSLALDSADVGPRWRSI